MKQQFLFCYSNLSRFWIIFPKIPLECSQTNGLEKKVWKRKLFFLYYYFLSPRFFVCNMGKSGTVALGSQELKGKPGESYNFPFKKKRPDARSRVGQTHSFHIVENNGSRSLELLYVDRRALEPIQGSCGRNLRN